MNTTRITTTIFPSQYIQGPGALSRLPGIVGSLGGKALVIHGKASTSSITNTFIKPYLAASSTIYTSLSGNGECTHAEIQRIVSLIQEQSVSVNAVIGVGGGKVIDTSKAVANSLNIPSIICPTIASSDAPCSALSIIYSEAGEVAEVLKLKSNPFAVIVDTRVICQAPVRYLIAGIGDALSTWFEAESCRQYSAPNCASSTDAGLFDYFIFILETKKIVFVTCIK